MKLRKATHYERFQWLRYRRNPDDPGLILKYQFKVTGDLEFQMLNTALKAVLLSEFNSLLSYFLERGNDLLVGHNRVRDNVVDVVTDQSQWQHSEPMDPSGDALFRFACFVESEKIVFLKFEFSHLVFDGECYQPFLKAFSGYWNRHKSIDDAAEESSEIAFLQIDEMRIQKGTLDYWKTRLQGTRLFQPLPFCYKTPKEKGNYLSVKRTLSEVAFAAIDAIQERCNVTLFQFVVAVTAAVVRLYSASEEDGEECITIAHTVNCRDEQQAYGCYTNLIPLFIKTDLTQAGSGLLAWVKQERLAVREHQRMPVQQLIECADPQTHHGDRLLNLLVNNSDGLIPYATPELAGCKLVLIECPDTGGQSDLTINYSCDGNRLFLSFDSSSRFLSGEALTALADNFVKVAAFIATSPERPLQECTISGPLTPVICGDRSNLASNASILELFSIAAKRRADEYAISDERTRLTYRQTHTAIGHLYRAIITHLDIPIGAAIGVFLERTVALPVAYFSALASRRAFTPMDPLLPDERLCYMMDVSRIGIILVDDRTHARAAALFPSTLIINVTTFLDTMMLGPTNAQNDAEEALVVDAKATVTAYVMFTSGSTGRPKGVAVSARSLENFLVSMQASPGFQPGERMLALTPISFDISILELLLPLIYGGSLHIVSDQTRVSAGLLARVIDEQSIDVVQATPSTWRMLRQVGWRASDRLTILCGGEVLDKELAGYLLTQTRHLYNMYGPTETTIWASCCRVTEAGRIPLGQPVFNSEFYILDSQGNSVMPGMQGELVIAGECVGAGYLNVPSEQNFIRLPTGVRAYKTGDIVHYLSQQEIVYVGRRDNQLKVNGYRIDTDEVSQRLRALAPDATVFTVVRHRPEAHLCCFVWIPEGGRFDVDTALQWCRQTFPYYMIPKAVHCLSRIPLTANGKADIKMLSEAAMTDLPLVVWPSCVTPKPMCHSGDLQWQGDQQGRSIEREIQSILLEKLGVSVLDFDQPLGWLGLNSISYNLLAVVIQQRFDIALHSYEFYQLNTINDVAGAIRQRQSPEQTNKPKQTWVNHRPSSMTDTKLAIVGMAAILPGGDDAETFWRALLECKDCIVAAPADRYLPDYRAGFIPSASGFDARFFSISPLEATKMDPRQRLLLQTAWKALEDANFVPSQLSGGHVGCYMAATGCDYALLQARSGERQTPYSLSGHSLSMLANRLSAFFDWKGPSFTLDTACSGTLAVLVKACRDLQFRVCDAAMVGGINLILDTQINEGLEAGRFMSPDGRCATFDESANGYVRGEGVGCFFVKRLQDAQADGDLIHAVIDSVAENHGGKANSLTAPNPDAQYRLLLKAYTPELARRVSYIETHGTGTRLGDPIEVAALKRALRELTGHDHAQTIWLGAVKTNIGHLEPAAGVASVVKVIKAFEHKQLPANLHFHNLNSEIDLSSSPFEVLTRSIPWQSEEPLTAGVSSFGFGGANAHVVLSEPSLQERRPTPHYDHYLIPVSARTESALLKRVALLADFVEERRAELAELGLTDLAFTLSCGREHFEYRQAWWVGGVDELLTQLYSCSTSVYTPRHHQLVDDTAVVGVLDDPDLLAHIKTRYLKGYHIDWQRLYEGVGTTKMRLPTYSFDEREYWYNKN